MGKKQSDKFYLYSKKHTDWRRTITAEEDVVLFTWDDDECHTER